MNNLFISIVVYKTSINILNSCLTTLDFLSNKSQLFIWDNSKDPVIQKFCNDHNLNYKGSNNIGFGRGHNKNIINFCSSKKFKSVLILNPDLMIRPCDIKRLLTTLEKNLNCKLISPLLINEDGTKQNSIRKIPNFFDFVFRLIISDYKNFKINNKNIFSVPFVHGACYLIRAEDVKKLYNFDNRFFLYCEDLDLCRKVIENNGLILVDPNVKAIHLHNKASHRSLRLFVVHAWSIIQYFYKWGLFNNKKVKIVNNKFDNYLN